MAEPSGGCVPLVLIFAFLAIFGVALIPISAPNATGDIFREFGAESTTSAPAGATAMTASAANAGVTHVRAVQTGADTWTLHVTVAHPDTGWDDYADGWDIVLPDGTVIKPNLADPFTRLLLHPHETEQPFTRSQSGIVIPAGVTHVTVRAHDLVDGWGGREVVVDLTADSGPDFEVERQS
ncbi:MAG: hypothetical protein K8S97_07635 [Anaerolineae bacterium]|nr:hypothetical protein [Anaerolineae bacterium]